MQHTRRGPMGASGRLGPCQQRVADLLVGVAIMDHDRLAEAAAERQLPSERLALHLGWREIAVEVEPDLPHRDAGRISGERLDPRPCRLVRRGSVVGMDTDRREQEIGVLRRQFERALRRREIPAWDKDPSDARGTGALDDRIAIAVKGGMLQVAVRVDDPRQAPRGTPSTQIAVPAGPTGVASSGSSVRGKSGSGVPVCQPASLAPHASKAARPGPPDPRPSYDVGTPS
jgi:hypothetical protein